VIKVAEPYSYKVDNSDQVRTDPTTTQVSGTSNANVSYTLIFFNEMKRYWNELHPPFFDYGAVTEILGKGKYKVKAVNLGSVITAIYTAESNAALFPWQSGNTAILKGAIVLLLSSISQTASPNSGSPTWTIVSFRQTGAFDPNVSVYPV